MMSDLWLVHSGYSIIKMAAVAKVSQCLSQVIPMRFEFKRKQIWRTESWLFIKPTYHCQHQTNIINDPVYSVKE